MNNLLDLNNAADKAAISQTNFQRVDTSLAFCLLPSMDLTGNPNVAMGGPVAGAFVKGQFWVDGLLATFVCTASGTPGEWLQQTPAIVAVAPAAPIPVNYLIRIPNQHWAEFYWDGNQWLPVSQLRNPGADSDKITADSTAQTADQN